MTMPKLPLLSEMLFPYKYLPVLPKGLVIQILRSLMFAQHDRKGLYFDKRFSIADNLT